MRAYPGEGLAEATLPVGWADGDPDGSVAVLRAAAHVVCRRLLPVAGDDIGMQYAVTLPCGCPAVVELDALSAFGAKVLIRSRAGAREAAADMARAIRDLAIELAASSPHREKAVSTPHELPF